MGAARLSMRDVLVVGQLALSMVLLVVRRAARPRACSAAERD